MIRFVNDMFIINDYVINYIIEAPIYLHYIYIYNFA